MKANNLQKATILLKEIHELDAQLIQLDKKAMGIIEGEKHLCIELSFEKEAPENPPLQEHEEYRSMYSMLYPFKPSTPAANKESHKLKVSDKECLFVIGALIDCKKEYRRSLCEKIIELGVTL